MSTTQEQEFPFQIKVEEVVQPGVKKLRKVFKFLRIKHKVENPDEIKVKIENVKKIEIEPYNVIRIETDFGMEVKIHWYERNDKYFVSLTFIIQDYDIFFNNIDKFYDIDFEGRFTVEVKKDYAIIELKPQGKVDVSYYEG